MPLTLSLLTLVNLVILLSWLWRTRGEKLMLQAVYGRWSSCINFKKKEEENKKKHTHCVEETRKTSKPSILWSFWQTFIRLKRSRWKVPPTSMTELIPGHTHTVHTKVPYMSREHSLQVREPNKESNNAILVENRIYERSWILRLEVLK